ncbi:MAG: hypothetical protein HY940_03640 [Gammaproteobacteria bacterium]|nr:hypothetical protein [Gammaproteobacteria bacterium]
MINMNEMTKKMRVEARRHGESMRDQARAAAQLRKEEYLGARVPRELKDRVIAHANSLGIPVSILIRNILEESFKKPLVSSSGNSAGQGLVAGEGKYPGVLGWERITLNRGMSCASCGKRMSQGGEATLGVGQPGEGYVILCGDCKISY